MILGGIIGALVIGLMVVVYLLSTNSGNNNPGVAGTVPTTAAGTDTGANTGTDTQSNTTDASAAGDPPRMSLEEFKALYDDPAKRPIILDVRAKESFDEGHIAGSISFPEADVDARAGELPKDKLIVAYCQ